MKTCRSWVIMLAPVAFAFALVAACGGGGEPPETPTPEPTETPSATATPEAVGFLPRPTQGPRPGTPVPFPQIPTVVPASDAFFHHPEEDLLWGGPDDGVYSRASGHCANHELAGEFGVPGLIVERNAAFFLRWAVERQESWRWTGYYYGDWQIWQGDDPATAYLIHTGEERIAFRYHHDPFCI